MKRQYLILLLPVILFSCTEYYFNEPQPVDSENIYKMPGKFIGSWYIKDSMDIVREDYDSISIGKNFYHLTSRDQLKEEMSQIDLDSSIFMANNRIYYTENESLNGGFIYSTSNDTITINSVENEIVEFGKKAFLRKIDYGYILNVNHDKMVDWWSIKFIDTRDKESIVVRLIKDEDIGIFPSYKFLNEDYKDYVIAKWTTDDIQDFIDRGGFSDTTLILKYVDKLK